MHVTKRQLGEGYLVSTSVVLLCIVFGLLTLEGGFPGLWATAPVVPAVGLIALVVWFQRLELNGEQIWEIAMYAALGIGLVTFVLIGVHLSGQQLVASPELTVALTILMATGTIGGVLVGVSMALHSQTRELTLRNAVLYRLLRHNLRNDMTVVLAQLETLKTDLDESEREQIEQAEQKIYGLVELTDKVRQLNVMLENGIDGSTTIDLAAVLRDRVETLERSYPNVEISTDLSDTAYVSVEEQFGIVLDNVVESAITTGREALELTVRCTVEERTVTLQIEDHSQLLPEPDLSVIQYENVEQLEHGDSMELWLVYWLTEYNGGQLVVDTDGETRQITITLERAQQRPSGLSTLSGLLTRLL